MATPINGLGIFQKMPLEISKGLSGIKPSESGLSFQKLLLNSIAQTNSQNQMAEGAIGKSLAGDNISQIEVMVAMKKADLSLRMMTQIRNKLLDGFNEIKNLRM